MSQLSQSLPVKLEHGGDVRAAARRYGHDSMIDLSTGISPISYPAHPVSAESWQELPSQDAHAACVAAARTFYGVPERLELCVGPGTQALLQLVPQCQPGVDTVWIPAPTYNEHAPAWVAAGYRVTQEADLPDHARHAVMVVPNNPTGPIADEVLQSVASVIADRDGVLVIDGAFTTQSESARHMQMMLDYPNVVHLRSFGKFFGMAGLRLGFAIGATDVIASIDARLGPWAINNAALQIGTVALGDQAWATAHQSWLDRESNRLQTLLDGHGLEVLGGCALFQTIAHPDAHSLHDFLAENRIWSRKYNEFPTLLRLGIPGSEGTFSCLDKLLHRWQR